MLVTMYISHQLFRATQKVCTVHPAKLVLHFAEVKVQHILLVGYCNSKIITTQSHRDLTMHNDYELEKCDRA